MLDIVLISKSESYFKHYTFVYCDYDFKIKCVWFYWIDFI